MNMPRRLQALKLRDELRKMGIASDLVDLEALIDSSLTYPENYRNIIGRYKRVDNKVRKSRSTTLGSCSGLDLSYAQQSHQARTPHSRVMDEAFLARQTYTERQISKNCKLLDKWFKNPGKSDIVGIDAFGYSKKRKKRR